MSKDSFTPEEIQKKWGYKTVRSIYRMIDSGKINAFRPSGTKGSYRITMEEVERVEKARAAKTG